MIGLSLGRNFPISTRPAAKFAAAFNPKRHYGNAFFTTLLQFQKALPQ